MADGVIRSNMRFIALIEITDHGYWLGSHTGLVKRNNVARTVSLLGRMDLPLSARHSPGLKISGANDHQFLGVNVLLESGCHLFWCERFDLFLQFVLVIHRSAQPPQIRENSRKGRITGAGDLSGLQVTLLGLGQFVVCDTLAQ